MTEPHTLGNGRVIYPSTRRTDATEFCGHCGHHAMYHTTDATACTMCDCPRRVPW